ncbi:MAG: hypothetical protein IJ457_08930 [Clostridia bacterium]|nr:hypothetical protein [Clostridia bacterium]
MKDSVSLLRIATGLLISVLTALAGGALILVVLSAISLSARDPLLLVRPLSLAALALSSVICGVTSGILNRRCEIPVYIFGALSGAVLVLIIYILSYLPIGGVVESHGGVRVTVYLGIVLLSLIGSLIAKPRHKKRPKYAPKPRRR